MQKSPQNDKTSSSNGDAHNSGTAQLFMAQTVNEQVKYQMWKACDAMQLLISQ